MRYLMVVVLLVACSPSTPAGIYRIPVQISADEVELRTFIVATEPRTLVLYDGRDGSLFGRGLASPGWSMQVQPHEFDVPNKHPLLLVVRDGLLEDVGERPYRRLPIKPLDSESDTVTRIELESGDVKRTLFRAGDHLFTDVVEQQVRSDAVPNPLSVLNSVAGQGLVIPPFEDGDVESEWRDAVSSVIPNDPEKAMPCGASLMSVYRRHKRESISVPAGEFDAIRVTETIDACRSEDPAEVTVFRVERWFVPGLGPVRLTLDADSGGTRDYQLLKFDVSSNDGAIWPLSKGNRWVFEVTDGGGNAKGPMEVRVRDVRHITAP